MSKFALRAVGALALPAAFLAVAAPTAAAAEGNSVAGVELPALPAVGVTGSDVDTEDLDTPELPDTSGLSNQSLSL